MEDHESVEKAAQNQQFHIPQVVYVCAAIELLTTPGGSLCVVSYVRLIESAVCQRYYGVGTFVAEVLCKGDAVQSYMAYLMGTMSSFSSLPTLLLTLPYGILAEHVDRRAILLVNFVSTIISILYVIAICYYPSIDLKLLWLSGLFDIAGGGSSVSTVLVRSMMAECVPSSALSTLFYRLSAISMIVRLVGTSFGSWLLQNGAASTMLVGTSSKHPSPDLEYTVCEQSESIKLSTKTIGESGSGFEQHRPKASVFHALVQSLGSYKRLILHSKPFVMCLAIMFINTVALDSRALLHPWLSKRYNWDLATTGYILSVESLLGISILLVLQFISSRSSSMTFRQKRGHELRVAKMSLICAILGSVLLGFSES
ncbi:uncharacterized protein LY89DRAFT_730122 [Mollisia scopiformis]|uniref:Uncharacterized protein n=1 Tax=Mollisia scopiformis TaxID=149040 RepID=A0A194XMM0_MOLSC|nr:uncharacterized protein LY89DRAFT_730122 [Mollisia scopiformis]KUJ21339.1 hypothetical protein LY89DRAFT_730122 [Mollisia scopiformis]